MSNLKSAQVVFVGAVMISGCKGSQDGNVGGNASSLSAAQEAQINGVVTSVSEKLANLSEIKAKIIGINTDGKKIRDLNAYQKDFQNELTNLKTQLNTQNMGMQDTSLNVKIAAAPMKDIATKLATNYEKWAQDYKVETLPIDNTPGEVKNILGNYKGPLTSENGVPGVLRVR